MLYVFNYFREKNIFKLKMENMIQKFNLNMIRDDDMYKDIVLVIKLR